MRENHVVYCLACLSLCLVQVSAADRILFAGQSNMVGHTRDSPWSMSATLFDSFANLTASNSADKDDATFQRSLHLEIRQLFFSQCLARKWNIESDCNASSWSVTEAVMDLHHRGLVEGITEKVPHAYCTYKGDHSPYNSPPRGQVLEPTPVAYDSQCGFTFGHEFMFARSMVDRGFYQNHHHSGGDDTVIIDKVAVGGTEIYQHWYPEQGLFWPDIHDTIHSISNSSDQWVAFVWHQGSQESWTAQDTSLTYLGNLTHLVSTVRKLMCDSNNNNNNSPNSALCDDEGSWIPVVIVSAIDCRGHGWILSWKTATTTAAAARRKRWGFLVSTPVPKQWNCH